MPTKGDASRVVGRVRASCLFFAASSGIWACFGSGGGGAGDGGGRQEAGAPGEAGAAWDVAAPVDTGSPAEAGEAAEGDGSPTDGSGKAQPDGDAGCVPGVGLQNGDFSQGLRCWTTVVVSGSGSAAIGTSTYYEPTDANCDPPQNGHPFLSLGVYASDVYVSQIFTVPSTAQTLSWVEWNSLDPTTAKVSLVENGLETVIDSEVPPSLQALSNPSDYYSVICSGNSPTPVSKSIRAFAGQQVELRLRGTYLSGVNGLFTGYANVAIQ